MMLNTWSVIKVECATCEDFSHGPARFRAYRWNEYGLGGMCDEQQRL